MEIPMHARFASLALMIVTATAVVQLPAQQKGKQGPQPDKTYTSAKEVVAMMAKAKSERKQDQATFIQNLLRLAPYSANLEYRAGVGPAAQHEQEAELFYVIDGSGTLVTGGKLVGESRTNAANLTGTAIENGKSQAVAKGDFVIVPENTPHWFSKINGTLVMMSLHVPRQVPAR
jgi:mannose-6-phosphate isomerase-like protein (cupin superfamily)